MYINIHVGRAIQMKKETKAQRGETQTTILGNDENRSWQPWTSLFFCFLGFLNTLNRFRVLTVLSVFRTSDSAVEFLNSAPFLGLGGRKIWKIARNSKIVILARNLKMNFGAKFENWRHLSGAKFKNLNFGAKFKNLNFGAKFENLKIGAICRAGNLKKWRELWRHSF